MFEIPREYLSDLAFELLTSSTLDRYMRTAQTSKAAEFVGECLKRDPSVFPLILNHARTCVKTILAGSERQTEEVELAAILAALYQTTFQGMADLLNLIATIDYPPLIWLSAASRRWRQERATDQRVSLPLLAREITHVCKAAGSSSGPVPRGRVGVRNNASDQTGKLALAS